MKLELKHYLLLFGFLAFIIGALIYPYRAHYGPVRGMFFESFSALSHTLVFVIAWGYPFKSIKSILFGGVLMTILVSGFELLQKDENWQYYQDYLPNVVLNYAKNGVFDAQDMWAGVLGSAIAMVLGILVVKFSANNVNVLEN